MSVRNTTESLVSNGLSIIVCVVGKSRFRILPIGSELSGPWTEINMSPGHSYLLRGHDVYHCVPPLLNTELPRVTLVMNYYLDGDFSRPDGIDEQHYA